MCVLTVGNPLAKPNVNVWSPPWTIRSGVPKNVLCVRSMMNVASIKKNCQKNHISR